jgi:ATP-dependent DNA helicase RecG
VREVGAIDNITYRQMADCDTLKASNDLRLLRNIHLLKLKGKGKATYYIAGASLNIETSELSTEADTLNTEARNFISTEGESPIAEARVVPNTEVKDVVSTEALGGLSTEANKVDRNALIRELPPSLETKILELRERESNPEKIKEVIKVICNVKPFKLVEIASLLQKGDNYISRKYIKPMIDSGELKFLHPEMVNHPEQAYINNN